MTILVIHSPSSSDGALSSLSCGCGRWGVDGLVSWTGVHCTSRVWAGLQWGLVIATGHGCGVCLGNCSWRWGPCKTMKMGCVHLRGRDLAHGQGRGSPPSRDDGGPSAEAPCVRQLNFPYLGVFRLMVHPKRDGSSIIRACKAGHTRSGKIGSTIAVVGHT